MNSDSSKRVPELRFRDDEGKRYPDWKIRLLGDFVKFSKGRGISRADITDDGSCKCIRYGELYTLYKETISDVFSTTNVPVPQLFLSQKNDVVIPASGETALDIVSASCVLISGVALGGDVNVLRSQQNGIFLAYNLNSKRWEISRFAQGISVIHLYAVHLKRIPIALPCKQEQQKIASFLSSIDTRIEQLEKKKLLFEQYKKGLMQKLFSQELRFKDEEGKEYPQWQKKRLGDFATFSKGKGISKNDIVNGGSCKCIRYGELYTQYDERIFNVVSSTNVPTSKLFLSKKDDVILPASGETALDIASASCVLLDGVALGGDLNVIRSQQVGVFLAYYLNYKKREISRFAQGISVIHLYAVNLKLLELALPCLKEQQKIANFLSSVDRKIELISEQIEKTREFKKGLLQQMFV